MYLQDILRCKGQHVHTIFPDASCDQAVAELVRLGVGSLVVSVDRGRTLLGIITERDLLRAHARQGRLHQLFVADVMSPELVVASPADELTEAMRLMTHHRVRHLPIVGEGYLCGLVSIGDLVKAHHDQLAVDNHFMRSYILGEGGELATIDVLASHQPRRSKSFQ